MSALNLPENPVVLCLDLSLACTGWALHSLDGIRSGRVYFPREANYVPAIRFARFNVWLANHLNIHGPDRVFYEIPICRAQGQVQDALIGLKTRVDEACAVRGIPLAGLYPSTIKKCVTGNGNASKSEMKARAVELFPHYCASADAGADEADSLMLLWIYLNQPEMFEPKPKKARVKKEPK